MMKQLLVQEQSEDNSPSPSSSATPTFQKKQARKISKTVFQEKTSLLDHTSEESLLRTSRLWGFFNLLSISFVFFFVVSQSRQFILEGTLVGMGLLKVMLGRNDLFLAWLMLIFISFLSVPFQKFYIYFKIKSDVLMIAMHVLVISTLLVFSFITIFDRNWPAVQTAFFLSETCVLALKIHSYVITNREFHKKWELELREKSKEHQKTQGQSPKQEKQQEKDQVQIDEITKVLRYPHNVTFHNFLMFLLFPTLVYELEYPRTPRIRWSYFFEKVFSFIGLISVLHVIVVNYIEPILVNTAKLSMFEAIANLVIPCLLGHLIIFYMIFDIFGNAIGELTRFADREFYSDWWNSTTFDEYARKWNKPVHEWLLRHIYLESIESYKLSQINATILTFCFSSILHEIFMACLFQIFKPYLFFFQMLQVPLIIYVGRHMKGKRIGNMFFWFGIILGPPLITVLYCREYYLQFENLS